jgi:hypothetical protein
MEIVMKASYRGAVLSLLGLALVLGIVLSLRAAEKAAPGATAGPTYTVVNTDGAHLIVTDNLSNTLYFYAIAADAKIGDELKLRGSLDLTQVGKPVLKPTTNK